MGKSIHDKSVLEALSNLTEVVKAWMNIEEKGQEMHANRLAELEESHKTRLRDLRAEKSKELEDRELQLEQRTAEYSKLKERVNKLREEYYAAPAPKEKDTRSSRRGGDTSRGRGQEIRNETHVASASEGKDRETKDRNNEQKKLKHHSRSNGSKESAASKHAEGSSEMRSNGETNNQVENDGENDVDKGSKPDFIDSPEHRETEEGKKEDDGRDVEKTTPRVPEEQEQGGDSLSQDNVALSAAMLKGRTITTTENGKTGIDHHEEKPEKWRKPEKEAPSAHKEQKKQGQKESWMKESDENGNKKNENEDGTEKGEDNEQEKRKADGKKEEADGERRHSSSRIRGRSSRAKSGAGSRNSSSTSETSETSSSQSGRQEEQDGIRSGKDYQKEDQMEDPEEKDKNRKQGAGATDGKEKNESDENDFLSTPCDSPPSARRREDEINNDGEERHGCSDPSAADGVSRRTLANNEQERGGMRTIATTMITAATTMMTATMPTTATMPPIDYRAGLESRKRENGGLILSLPGGGNEEHTQNASAGGGTPTKLREIPRNNDDRHDDDDDDDDDDGEKKKPRVSVVPVTQPGRTTTPSLEGKGMSSSITRPIPGSSSWSGSSSITPSMRANAPFSITLM